MVQRKPTRMRCRRTRILRSFVPTWELLYCSWRNLASMTLCTLISWTLQVVTMVILSLACAWFSVWYMYIYSQERMSHRRWQRSVQLRKTCVVEFLSAKTIFGLAARLTEATHVHRPGLRYQIRYSASVHVASRTSKYGLLRNSTTDVSRMQRKLDAPSPPSAAHALLT